MNAIIVAKGKKSRRLGLDKALVKIEGETLIELLLEKIDGLFNKVYLVTASPEKFKFLKGKGLRIIKDELQYGPLGGIYLGLRESSSFYNFVTGADLVFLNRKVLSGLMRKKKGYQALVPKDGESVQPLCGIYAKSVLPVMERMLKAENYRLTELLPEIETEYISAESLERFGDPEVLFFNLNTRKDLEKARSLWKRYC